MCHKYEEFFAYSQPLTVGGPTGQYYVPNPVPNAEMVEWAFLQVSTGSNAAAVAISGIMDLVPIPQPGTNGKIVLDGTQSYNGAGAFPLFVIKCASNNSVYSTPPLYFPLQTMAQLNLAIGSGGTTGALVTVQFRWLTIPLAEVFNLSRDPVGLDGENEHLINMLRAKRIDEQLRQVEQLTKTAPMRRR